MASTKEKIFNIPNFLTLSRIIFAIIFCVLLFSGYSNLSLFIIFLIGAITDLFDGMLARKLNQVTKFGKFLDAVADRTFFAIILLSLIFYSIYNKNFTYFSFNLSFAVLLLIPREIMGIVGNLISLFRKKGILVIRDFINKFTAFMQCITLASIILNFRTSFYLAIVTFICGLFAGLNHIKKSLNQ